jgi:hypothetical protein
MPVNDLAIRFTDEHYATKQDVAKTLGSAVVDALWGTILDYRTTFARILPLQAIDKQPLQIVLTPSNGRPKLRAVKLQASLTDPTITSKS